MKLLVSSFCLAALLASSSSSEAKKPAPLASFGPAYPCTRNADCVFAVHICTPCPPCPAGPRAVVNRKTARQQLAAAAVAGACLPPRCHCKQASSGWLWSRPACLKGLCRATLVGRELHGDTKTKRFHEPGCKDYRCASCTKRFRSTVAASKAGYSSHLACDSRQRVSPLRMPVRPNCKKDTDCAIGWRPCGYRQKPCPGKAWRDAASKQENAERLARWGPKVPACSTERLCVNAKGYARWLGCKPVCLQGRCALLRACH